MPAVWETTPVDKPDLAVLIPSRGLVSTEFLVNFRNLQLPPKTIVLIDKFLPLDISRNNLVQSALNTNAERIMFLDDDVLMPADGIMKLIAFQDAILAGQQRLPNGFTKHGYVVSALYFAKKVTSENEFQAGHAAAWKTAVKTPIQFAPIETFKKVGDKMEPIDETVECDVIGAGAMLVHSDVFRKLSKPWFTWRVGTDLPGDKVSEDFAFNLHAETELGIKPVCATSIRCEHLVNSAKIRSDGKMTMSVM